MIGKAGPYITLPARRYASVVRRYARVYLPQIGVIFNNVADRNGLWYRIYAESCPSVIPQNVTEPRGIRVS